VDELTTGQLSELKADLGDLEKELVRLLKVALDRTATVDLDQPIGRLSRMDALQQQKMAEAERARHTMRLGLVRVALKAYDEDDYGFCRRCGECIPFARLKARPESPCCVPCLSAVESGGR